MSQVLIESGHITPENWSRTLGSAIKARLASGAGDTPETYYAAVSDAMEAILNLNETEVDSAVQAWRNAFETTPHGKPVILRRNSQTEDMVGAETASLGLNED